MRSAAGGGAAGTRRGGGKRGPAVLAANLLLLRARCAPGVLCLFRAHLFSLQSHTRGTGMCPLQWPLKTDGQNVKMFPTVMALPTINGVFNQMKAHVCSMRQK